VKTDRTPVRGKGWKRSTSVASDKFTTVSKAILASLTTTPITFTRLVERVRARLPRFDGSVAWYTITCARELEVRGRLVRQTRPVLYARPGRSAGVTRQARSRAKRPPAKSRRDTTHGRKP
jgi:hypothetical protein